MPSFFGVTLPRNSRDQGWSPALNRIELTQSDSHERRLEVLRTLEVGDLIYIPGHVMMVIGHEDGLPYVIHDTTGITYRNGDSLRRVTLNGAVPKKKDNPAVPVTAGSASLTIEKIPEVAETEASLRARFLRKDPLSQEGQSPEPLTMVFRRSSRGTPERSLNVVFFDASGEQLYRKEDLGRFGKLLYVASGIIVVLPPGIFPGL